MSDDPKTPAVVTATVTPEPVPESFGSGDAAALARDLAHAMYAEDVILKKHGLTPGQFETLKKNEWFATIVKQMEFDWNSPKNTQQRLATEAAVGLENVLPDLIARMKAKNEPLQGIAQLSKVLADIAGVGGANKAPAPATEKFNIVINLGGEQEVYQKTKPVIEALPVANDPVAEVRGSIHSLLALQTEPEPS